MLLQSKKDDCGKTVVRRILSLLYKDRRFYQEPITKPCNNFKEIRETLEIYGVRYESFQVSEISMIPLNKRYVIAQILHENLFHFVIILKMKKTYFWVYDPAFGNLKMDINEFKRLFTGRLMILYTFKKEKKPNNFNLLKKYEVISYFVLSAGAMGTLAPFLLIESIAKNFLNSLLCISASILFILGIITLNFYVRHRLEKSFLLPRLFLSRRKEEFVSLQKILSLSVKRICYMAVYSFSILLLFITLLANNVFFSILAIIVVFFDVVRVLLQREKSATERYCTIEESIFLNHLADEKAATKHYLIAKRKAGNYVGKLLLIYVIEFFSSLILTLAIMRLSEITSLNFLIYSLLLTYSFSYVLRQFISSLDLYSEISREINVFDDSLSKKKE